MAAQAGMKRTASESSQFVPGASRSSCTAPLRTDAFTGCTDADVSPDMSKRARMSVGLASGCSRAPSFSGCSDTLSATLPDEPVDCSQTFEGSQVSVLPSELCSPVLDAHGIRSAVREASTAGVDGALPRPPALSTASSEDVCPDHEHEHVIPIVERGISDTPCIPTISADTLGRILHHEFDDVVERVIILDCRYVYEFAGGHIVDAISAYTAEGLRRALFEDPPVARAFPKQTLGSPVGGFFRSSSNGFPPMSSVTNFTNRSRMTAAPSSEELSGDGNAPTPSLLMSRLAVSSPHTVTHVPPHARAYGKLPLASVVPLRVPQWTPLEAADSSRGGPTAYRAAFAASSSEEATLASTGLSRIASLDTLSLSVGAATQESDSSTALSARGLSRDAQRSCDSVREVQPRAGARATEKRTIVVLHCEFSMERGPRMWTLARRWDRHRNIASFPNLCYPDMYLLHKGYKNFFSNPGTQSLCLPVAHVSMHEPAYEEECKAAGEEVKASYDAVQASDLYIDFTKYQPHRARSRRPVSATSPFAARVTDSEEEPPRLPSAQGSRPASHGAPLPKPNVSRVLFSPGDCDDAAGSRIMRAPTFGARSTRPGAALPPTDENSASENEDVARCRPSRGGRMTSTSGAWQSTSMTLVRSPPISSSSVMSYTSASVTMPSVCVLSPPAMLLPMVDLAAPPPDALPGFVPPAVDAVWMHACETRSQCACCAASAVVCVMLSTSRNCCAPLPRRPVTVNTVCNRAIAAEMVQVHYP